MKVDDNEREASIRLRRRKFESDPFGYGVNAHRSWAFQVAQAGFPGAVAPIASSDDLKAPILWLTTARALSDAAAILFRSDPLYVEMPIEMHDSIDSQFRAIVLMLVGYSLEVCLKGTQLLAMGKDAYTTQEKKFKHHKLERLATIIPGLNSKDRAILNLLTEYVEWAGRYPDPGSERAKKIEEIHGVAQTHRITIRDVFDLASRVMQHVQTLT